ncbi:hypothetical protein H920_17205 [Fukomys damarensis]|uniref:Uncharacterized protein n=1 Tax=Fukomys damarensis TaxID=885580 RepID=A0A091DF30_FUKDA|nr:hypothetical protein H920_17205 [Fukomys damarensis]
MRVFSNKPSLFWQEFKDRNWALSNPSSTFHCEPAGPAEGLPAPSSSSSMGWAKIGASVLLPASLEPAADPDGCRVLGGWVVSAEAARSPHLYWSLSRACFTAPCPLYSTKNSTSLVAQRVTPVSWGLPNLMDHGHDSSPTGRTGTHCGPLLLRFITVQMLRQDTLNALKLMRGLGETLELPRGTDAFVCFLNVTPEAPVATGREAASPPVTHQGWRSPRLPHLDPALATLSALLGPNAPGEWGLEQPGRRDLQWEMGTAEAGEDKRTFSHPVAVGLSHRPGSPPGSAGPGAPKLQVFRSETFWSSQLHQPGSGGGGWAARRPRTRKPCYGLIEGLFLLIRQDALPEVSVDAGRRLGTEQAVALC